jgi:hypothetical protein
VRHSPTPWTVEKTAYCWFVKDANGTVLFIIQPGGEQPSDAEIAEGDAQLLMSAISNHEELLEVCLSCLHQLCTDSDLDHVSGHAKYADLVTLLRLVVSKADPGNPVIRFGTALLEYQEMRAWAEQAESLANVNHALTLENNRFREHFKEMLGEEYAKMQMELALANEHHALQVQKMMTACKAANADLVAACEATLAWATRECMPQGGKNDGPWEQLEEAIAKAKGP